MIYTVTLNPSLDYIVRTKRFSAGEINRTESEAIYPGGKGVNVSIVLKNLGISSKYWDSVQVFRKRNLPYARTIPGADL